MKEEDLCALLFDSVHFVLEAERRLAEKGMFKDVIPVPKDISPDCGVALQIKAADLDAAMALISDLEGRLKGAWRLAREGGRVRFVEPL